MNKSITVCMEAHLPVCSATDAAMDDLGVETSALTALGDLMPDGGRRLLQQLLALAQQRAPAGRVDDVRECLGSMVFDRCVDGQAVLMRHTLWVYFPEFLGAVAGQRAVLLLGHDSGAVVAGQTNDGALEGAAPHSLHIAL